MDGSTPMKAAPTNFILGLIPSSLHLFPDMRSETQAPSFNPEAFAAVTWPSALNGNFLRFLILSSVVPRLACSSRSATLHPSGENTVMSTQCLCCLLYTSDAADEEDSVD